MEYVTLHSVLKVSISGFKDQSDADSATFSLVRNDNRKNILDQSSDKVRKGSSFKPLKWEFTLDEDIIKDALSDEEMQCKVSISVTAGGKTWTPDGQLFVLYRNRITVTARSAEGKTIAGARCTCTIKAPPDFSSKMPRVYHTLATRDDGTAEFQLDAPGNLDLEWLYPYYPQDTAAWTSAAGAQREATLLERERKARFIWPDLEKGDDQKHYINLRPDETQKNHGRKVYIEGGVAGGLAGDKIYLTVELSPGGTPKQTITLTLEDGEGSAGYELDFNGKSGITAKLGISTVEGSTDETVNVTSWNKLDIQPYHPVPDFFKNNEFPEPLAQKVKTAFDPDFTDVEFLPSKELGQAFPGVIEKGKFEIVSMTRTHAEAAGFDAAESRGDAALVYFKLGKFVAESPVDWIVGPDDRFGRFYRTNPQTVLHSVFAHGCYEPREVRVSLTLDGEHLESEPQSSTFALTASNIDANEDLQHRGTLILPWNSSTPSYWQAEGQNLRGDITMGFIEVDRDKMKNGQYEFKLKLPDGAHGRPKQLAIDGSKIQMKVNLRAYQYSEATASVPPLIYVALDPDYASDENSQRLVDSIKSAMGPIIGAAM
ncbi:MAG TPA: hypothetical protein VGK48_02170 [Terriglobia bacterium]